MTALIGGLVANIVGEVAKNKMGDWLNFTKTPTPKNPGKGMVQSRTMWGAVLLAVSPFIGATLGLGEGEVIQAVEGLTMLVGVVVVWIGRKGAKRPIGRTQ